MTWFISKPTPLKTQKQLHRFCRRSVTTGTASGSTDDSGWHLTGAA